jgi:hypothetical protein
MGVLTTLERRFHDAVNVVLAILLFVSPWVLSFSGAQTAAWNAWIAGVLVALVAVAALVSSEDWPEWINAVLGIWILIAPWVLGFGSMREAMAAHIVLGVLIAGFAAWGIWSSDRPQRRATA